MGGRPALLLVGGPAPGSRAYTRNHLALVRSCCVQATVALRNAELVADLIEAERRAAAGRAALAAAHDLGKGLDWIRELSQRIPSRSDDPVRLRRDAQAIRDLASELAANVRVGVREAAAGLRAAAGTVPVGVLLDRLLADTARREVALPVCSIDPRVRDRSVGRDLEHALRPVLDNALRASPPQEPVRIHATQEPGSLRLSIRDRGSGLGPLARRRAFEPGFTTHAAAGGCGIGLAIAREVMKELGGSIALEAAVGGGTRAVVEVPWAG
jgi:signal transduction histidine kinase